VDAQQLNTRCAQLEAQLAEANEQLVPAKAHLAKQQETSKQSKQAEADAAWIAKLEHRLAAALKQVDESVGMATKSEGQKRELREQVAALTKQVDALTKANTESAALAVVQPGTPTSSSPPPVSPEAARTAAELERQRDYALAALVSEAHPLLKHAALTAQLSTSLVAEVREAVEGLGLDESAQEQMSQAVTALKAGLMALQAGTEERHSLHEK